MDAVLGMAVIGTVCLGLLVLIGHEMSAALEGLRRVVEQWAMADLRLKRRAAGLEAADEPLAWLSQASAQALGEGVALASPVVFRDPLALACHDALGGRTLVFSPAAPGQVRKLGRPSQRLAGANPHPLVPWRGGTRVVELTPNRGGVLFALEWAHAWKQLTGQETPVGRLWLYLPPDHAV